MNLFETKNTWTPLLLRTSLSIVLWPHGAQKLLGWFGGFGFQGIMNFFTSMKGLPWIIGFLVVVIEFFGSLFLLLGLATRLWSGLMIILFIGIAWSSHLQNGFFMNWNGNQKGEGIEYFLLAIGIAASLVVTGGGRYALDSFIARSQTNSDPVRNKMAEFV